MKVIREYHDNGQIRSETFYANKKRHGMERAWYKNGQLEAEHVWVNGKLHGIVKWWYEDGQVEGMSFYDEDDFITVIPEGTAYPLEEEPI